MRDTSNFGFGKLVPGFDFLQSLAKGASSSIPQLPNLSNWVAPTISVEELEKPIDELKAVQFWLEQNSRALAATIQALEVQKMTLATLKGMNFSMGDVANAFKLKTADTVMSGVQKAADTVTGAAEAVAGAAARATGRVSAAEEEAEDEGDDAEPAAPPAKAKTKGSKASAAAAPTVVDPMQWWGALTGQFQQIAANAMKDAANQTACSVSTSRWGRSLRLSLKRQPMVSISRNDVAACRSWAPPHRADRPLRAVAARHPTAPSASSPSTPARCRRAAGTR